MIIHNLEHILLQFAQKTENVCLVMCVDGKMILNDAGQIAQKCWLEIPDHYPNVILDEFVIMPNHIHGIIIINVGANNHSPLQNGSQQSLFRSPSRTIGSIIRGFKIGITKWFLPKYRSL